MILMSNKYFCKRKKSMVETKQVLIFLHFLI